MSERENYLRAVEMKRPWWIPCKINFSRAIWRKYREKLEDLILRYPTIFGNYEKGSYDFDFLGVQYEGNLVIDEWKCVWYYAKDGITGQVIKHPIEDWEAFESYKPPNYPLWGPPDGGGRPIKHSWYWVAKSLKEARERGELTVGKCPHGFMFQRLYYLRGFKNLMMDFIREEPRLNDLIEMVLEQNLKLIDKWLELGPLDVLYFGDDLGMQNALPIRPEAFRKYLLPAYTKMFRRVREAGTHVYFHSDGHILEVAEDLIKAGVSILNIQDRVNGIENIRKTIKGKVCIDLDIDRQFLMPHGTPKEILNHVEEAVKNLGSRDGGLMLSAGILEDVPLTNIEALCQAMKKYQCYYSKQ